MNAPSPEPPPLKPASPLLIAALVLLGGAALTAVALTRQADGDEGLYHHAALRVAEGSLPYRDFIYPQMPYLLPPYSLCGRSFFAARLLSVMLSMGSLLLLGLLLRRRGAGPVAASMLLLLGSATFLVWAPTFKSYPLTIALSMLALYLVQERTPARSFAAGMALGALVGIRLLYAPLPLLFGIWMLAQGGDRRRHAILLAAGGALALVPGAALALLAPDRFLFDVVGHHSIRSASGAVGAGSQKWELLTRLSLRPQWVLLLLLTVVGVARRRPPGTGLILASAVSLSAMSLLPTPAYEQYFVCVVPFVLLLASPALEGTWTAARGVSSAALLGLYAAAAPSEFRHQIGVHPSHDLAEIRAVSDAIRRHAAPGEEVLSFWAGYTVLSGTRVPPGLDNCCAYLYSLERMTSESRRLHGIPEEETVKEWVRKRRHRVVQIGGYAQTDREITEFRALLAASGYRIVYDRFNISVHVRE